MTLIAVLALSACSREPGKLTDAQRTAIADEVSQAGNAFEAAAEQLEPDLFKSYVHNSPKFVFLTPDGQSLGYDQAVKLWSQFISAFASQNNTMRHTRVIVLSRDTAIYSWEGAVHLTTKDGTILKAAPFSGTDVFRKVGTSWKIIYIHESGPPPSPVTNAATPPASGGSPPENQRT
ncbi:MAG: nuclear transport factor 2 family protein [Rhodanobacteraceae bacterium]